MTPDDAKPSLPTAYRLPPTSDSRLVIFDLGRVLVRICDNWQHAGEVAGIWRSPALRDLSAGEQTSVSQVIHDFDTGRIDLDTFARRAAELRGLTVEQVLAINHNYLLGPFPGAEELIDDLHQAGHATACLSNTNASHWQAFSDPADAHGRVVGKLGRQFASHLMGVRKPDPEIYARVERETGIGAERIIFFDDLADNVQAARRRGWNAHLVEVCENPIPAIRKRLMEDGVL